MDAKELYRLWEEWNKAGGRLGTHQRFGQYVMNKVPELNSVADPLVFYCEKPHKAYRLLSERYFTIGEDDNGK